MRGLTKEQIILLVDSNFDDHELIMENDVKLKEMWNQFGGEYYIENNEWVLTKKSPNWND